MPLFFKEDPPPLRPTHLGEDDLPEGRVHEQGVRVEPTCSVATTTSSGTSPVCPPRGGSTAPRSCRDRSPSFGGSPARRARTPSRRRYCCVARRSHALASPSISTSTINDTALAGAHVTCSAARQVRTEPRRAAERRQARVGLSLSLSLSLEHARSRGRGCPRGRARLSP